MKTIQISDVTLRMAEASALSFKERVEIARTLDRLGVDEIELPALRDGKAGVLSNKTIASVVSSARLSAAVGTTEESVMISIFPPLSIDTILLFLTSRWRSAATASSPEFSTIIL